MDELSTSKMAERNDISVSDYTHFLQFSLKLLGCWEWFPNSDNELKILLNNGYLALVLFTLFNFLTALIVHLCTEWVDVISNFDSLADALPAIVTLSIIIRFAVHREDLYEMVEFMNKNFKFHSARGLTNMTMASSYVSAKKFAYVYTASCMFSVTTYVTTPMIFHLLTREPLQYWYYIDAEQQTLYVTLAFLRLCFTQSIIGFAFGILGAFYGAHCILLCGQLDLLCCSVRNARYTGLLQSGVQHKALLRQYADIEDDERHNYVYNTSETKDSVYHYDAKVNSRFADRRTQFNIYDSEFDAATEVALRECAQVCQVVAKYKEMFEEFVSPLLVIRVVQVTLYLCALMYAASVKLELGTLEYVAATAGDMFLYCYFGNQIIIQAGRVSSAAYQSAWQTMGVRARKLVLGIMLATRRALTLRAGYFLPMDLHTYIAIIKTSFSYYTLLDQMRDDEQ